MRKQVLIRRYTHGLVNAIPSRDEFLAVQARLAQFQGLLAEKPQFLEVLSSPFFPHSKRAGIASEVLTELFGMQKTPQEPADKKSLFVGRSIGNSPLCVNDKCRPIKNPSHRRGFL